MTQVRSSKFRALFALLLLSPLFHSTAQAEGCVQIYDSMACVWSSGVCIAAPPVIAVDEMRCITRTNFECSGDMGLVSGQQECGKYKSKSECNGKWVTGKVCGASNGKKYCCLGTASEPPSYGITIYFGVCKDACEKSGPPPY